MINLLQEFIIDFTLGYKLSIVFILQLSSEEKKKI
jgi:hypothetical protein